MSTLTSDERQKLLARLDPLVSYLGASGDWGYGTRLGDATLALLELQQAVRATKVRNRT